MFNSDATPQRYSAKHEPGTFHIAVDIASGMISVRCAPVTA
jgi:hypothetical protein